MHKLITIKSLRTLVQAIFTLVCIWAGYRFYYFYLWAMGRSDVYVARPPAVEGFLPISALLGLKRLVLTGRYDEIHPAGLTIFLAALVMALLLRKGFCGWICPIGLVSNLVEKAGKKMRIVRHLPAWLDYLLLPLKYLLLGFFLYVIVWQMSLDAINAFIYSPYNIVVDGKMLLFFIAPSQATLVVVAFLVLISLVLVNFWCRYLCPYGALLGILAFFGPLHVRREASLCIDCKKCDKTCPASIRISHKQAVRSPECIGCVECVAVCPQKDCLTLSVSKNRRFSAYALPMAVLAVFLAFWAAAVFSGHWQTSVTPQMARQMYPRSPSLAHP